MVKPYHVYLIDGVASFTESWAECEAAIAGKHHKNFGNPNPNHKKSSTVLLARYLQLGIQIRSNVFWKTN